MAHDYSYNNLAGCVQQRRNRGTGFLVGVYNCEQSGMESDPTLPWATVCEEHHSIVCHSSLALAISHAADPEGWCEACRLGYLFNRLRNGYVSIEQGDVIGLVPTKAEASMIGSDAPIVWARTIAGHPRGEYKFVRATHEDMERNERERAERV